MWEIYMSGILYGQYAAFSREDAILAFVNDAGYESVSEAAELCGKTEEEFLNHIEVRKVLA